MKQLIILTTFLALTFACKDREGQIQMEPISESEQTAIYSQLTKLYKSIPTDSLRILVLPIDATCPSCRKKLLKSLVETNNRLPANHLVIISGAGGRKHIEGYFREHKLAIPMDLKQLALDSTGLMSKPRLFDEEPVIYYGAGHKITAKSKVYPDNVKQQINQFFKS